MNPVRICAGLLSPAGHRGKLSVLMFHRVLPRVDPLFPGEADVRRFDETLCWVGKWFDVLPLGRAVEHLAAGTLPARALAITFDDGYADNHDVALPLLARHGFPATFFIAADFLDGGRMWNDTIIESVRRFDGETLDPDLPGVGQLDLSSIAARSAAIERLLRELKHLPPAIRAAHTERIAKACRTALPDDLMMRSTQVRALRAAGMEIGAHTLSHPILAALDAPTAQREIEGGKELLEGLLQEPVELFAYPNGRPDRDYAAEHVEMVRAAGFKAAFSTAPGAADRASAIFELPRFTPWDRTELRFGLRLVANLCRTRVAAAGRSVPEPSPPAGLSARGSSQVKDKPQTDEPMRRGAPCGKSGSGENTLA